MIATGAVKGVASRRRERFGWRHRAYLGRACLFVFLCYLGGTRGAASHGPAPAEDARRHWVRGETLRTTFVASAGFYAYAAASPAPA